MSHTRHTCTPVSYSHNTKYVYFLLRHRQPDKHTQAHTHTHLQIAHCHMQKSWNIFCSLSSCRRRSPFRSRYCCCCCFKRASVIKFYEQLQHLLNIAKETHTHTHPLVHRRQKNESISIEIAHFSVFCFSSSSQHFFFCSFTRQHKAPNR